MASLALLREALPDRSVEELNEALRRHEDPSAAAEALLTQPSGGEATGNRQWSSTLRESRLREAFPSADGAVVSMALWELSDGSLSNAAQALSSLTGTPAPPDLVPDKPQPHARASPVEPSTPPTPASAVSAAHRPVLQPNISNNACNSSPDHASEHASNHLSDRGEWQVVHHRRPHNDSQSNGNASTAAALSAPRVRGEAERASVNKAMALRGDASRENKAKKKLIQLANDASMNNDHQTANILKKRADEADANATALSQQAANESFNALNDRQRMRWDLHGHDAIQVERLARKHAAAFNDSPCLLEITYVPGVGKHSDPNSQSIRKRALSRDKGSLPHFV